MTDKPPDGTDDRPLVLDEVAERLERFAALRNTDSAAADLVLDELGGTSDVDRDIIVELSGRAPKAVRPVAEFVVQLVTRIIFRSYQGTVIDRLRDLYARRLAWCEPKDPSRMALVRARLDSQRATSAYKHL